MLSVAGADHIITMDLHASQIQVLVHVGLDDPEPVLSQSLADCFESLTLPLSLSYPGLFPFLIVQIKLIFCQMFMQVICVILIGYIKVEMSLFSRDFLTLL